MIKLDVQDYCQDCPDFEPEIKSVMNYIGVVGEGENSLTFVDCVYSDRCKVMASRLKQTIKGSPNE